MFQGPALAQFTHADDAIDLLARLGGVRNKTPMHACRSGHLVAFLLAISVALGSGAARAHAIVVSAEPAVNAVVHGTTTDVVLRFNSRIDRERSRLLLVRADGSSTGLELKDTPSPDTLAATLAGLAPGPYRLRWQVLAIDGHITRGDIPFTVAP
jgi:copper resistance protein C